MRMGSQCSFFVCLLTFVFVLLVACFTVFTNCLLKAVAFCMGVLADLLLKLMFLLVCSGDFLLLSLFSVFQQVRVFSLWSQFCSSFSFHRFVLWSLMHFVMSSFTCF